MDEDGTPEPAPVPPKPETLPEPAPIPEKPKEVPPETTALFELQKTLMRQNIPVDPRLMDRFQYLENEDQAEEAMQQLRLALGGKPVDPRLVDQVGREVMRPLEKFPGAPALKALHRALKAGNIPVDPKILDRFRQIENTNQLKDSMHQLRGALNGRPIDPKLIDQVEREAKQRFKDTEVQNVQESPLIWNREEFTPNPLEVVADLKVIDQFRNVQGRIGDPTDIDWAYINTPAFKELCTVGLALPPEIARQNYFYQFEKRGNESVIRVILDAPPYSKTPIGELRIDWDARSMVRVRGYTTKTLVSALENKYTTYDTLETMGRNLQIEGRRAEYASKIHDEVSAAVRDLSAVQSVYHNVYTSHIQLTARLQNGKELSFNIYNWGATRSNLGEAFEYDPAKPEDQRTIRWNRRIDEVDAVGIKKLIEEYLRRGTLEPMQE